MQLCYYLGQVPLPGQAACLVQVWQDHVALGSDELLKYGLLAPQAGRVLVLLEAVLVAQVVDPQPLAFPACCIDLPPAQHSSGATPCRMLHAYTEHCTEPPSRTVIEECSETTRAWKAFVKCCGMVMASPQAGAQMRRWSRT